MNVDVRLQTFCPMPILSFYLLTFWCLPQTQVVPDFRVKSSVLLLGKTKCAYDEYSCDDNTLCYTKRRKCDGVYDCLDWSDEKGCSKYSFRKTNSCLNILSVVSEVGQMLHCVQN